MLCLSQKLSQLLEASCKKAFNFPSIPISVQQTAVDSEFDYVSNVSKELLEKHKEEMSKFLKLDQMQASGIASEISVQMPSNPYVSNAMVDSLGQINFKLKDDHYLQGIKQLAATPSGQQLSVAYEHSEEGKRAVLFPFSQIAEKPLLNTFRGANISETMARLQKTLGNAEVVRVGVIQNAQPFHGIIYAYLKAEQKKTGKLNDTAINFEKLAQFIVDQNLFTQEDVAAFGAYQINAISTDTELREVMEKLTNAAIGNFQETFSKFTPLQIQIVRGDKIEKSTFDVLQSCAKKGTLVKEGAHQINFSKNQNITLVDPVGALTREGFYLGLIQNLHIEQFVKEVHVAGDLQEESLHSGVLSLLKPCGIDATLKFYGHNNLFSEKKDKVEINTLSELFTQMKQLNIVRYKQKFPDIMPNLLEDQSELFLDQSLGWTRYLDHRKSRKTPYIMSVDSVLQFVHNNEKLTNSRMALLEMLQSYPQHKGDMSKFAEQFSFINPKERIFARILLYFPDVLHNCLLSNEFNPLVQYTEHLLGMVDFMQKENIFKPLVPSERLSESELANRIVLLDATNKILHKLFYIIGILNY